LTKLLTGLILLCTSLCGPLAYAEQTTILVLGDSISAAYGINIKLGWVNLLQQRLQKQRPTYRVINASVSGDTTRTGLNRLTAALKQHRPHIIIVALGANDGLRGMPFSEIENSLAEIIRRSQQQKATVLLVGIRLPPNYGAAYNAGFAAVYQRLKKRFKLTLLPHLMGDVSDHRELLQADGMHPTAAGQKHILENVWHALQPLLNR